MAPGIPALSHIHQQHVAKVPLAVGMDGAFEAAATLATMTETLANGEARDLRKVAKTEIPWKSNRNRTWS